MSKTTTPALPVIPVRASTSERCENCLGTGKAQDQERLGGLLRKRREASGAPLNATADKMGVSPGYLSDLERGKKNWTIALILKLESVLPSKAAPAKPKPSRKK